MSWQEAQTMRRILALVLAATLLISLTAPVAEAGGSTATNVALGLASFAVFNQLVGGFYYPRYAYATPAYYYPTYPAYPTYAAYPAYPSYSTVVYVQAPAPAPAPAQQYANVVQYPHGRYELRGDGIRTPYQWVWIPNPPPPPPAAPPAPKDQ